MLGVYFEKLLYGGPG